MTGGDRLVQFRQNEALETLRQAFALLRTQPLTLDYGQRSLAVFPNGVLIVISNSTGEALAISKPGMVCELHPDFVPPASFAEHL